MRGAAHWEMILVHGFRISIHAPHAGSGKSSVSNVYNEEIFQSTLPMRGAAYHSLFIPICEHIFQSTLPMRGAA